MKSSLSLLHLFCSLFLGVSLLFGQDVDQKNAKKHFDRGLAAIESAESLENFNEAINEFEEAKKYAPEWADIYYNLGIVYDKIERYQESLDNFNQYLKLSPNADDSDEVETMINKLEYKKEKATDKQNIYEKLLGTWDRYDTETDEKLNVYKFKIEKDQLVVETWTVGRGTILVPVTFDGERLNFNYLDEQTLYDSELEFRYSLIGEGVMKGTIQVKIVRKNPGTPFQLGKKPPMPMEMRKR